MYLWFDVEVAGFDVEHRKWRRAVFSPAIPQCGGNQNPHETGGVEIVEWNSLIHDVTFGFAGSQAADAFAAGSTGIQDVATSIDGAILHVVSP